MMKNVWKELFLWRMKIERFLFCSDMKLRMNPYLRSMKNDGCAKT
jgi:hypothetical protein